LIDSNRSRKWFVLSAVGAGVFLATIDGSIVNIALPTLVDELQTTFPVIQWVVLAYLLCVTTLMLSIGRLADMIGKKMIYASGFVVFTIGSTLCGLAPTVTWLIAFRVLQAVGAAMVMALGTAIITEAFPPQERGVALGISGSIVSIGIIIGPTIGGLILSVTSWHWIFLVNLPIGIIGTLMVLRFVPITRPPGGQRFDYLGALTLFACLLTLLLALTIGQQRGFTDGLILSLLLVGMGLAALFIWIERVVEQPMIDLRLFQDKLFTINLVTGFITFVAISGTLLLMPFFLEIVLGFPPRQVGLLLAVVPLAMVFVSPVSGFLSDRFGSRSITLIGLVILVFGYYFVSTLNTQTSGLEYVAKFLLIGVGMGIFQSPNNSAIMGSAPKERLGIVSGLLAVNRTLGQTTGIALLGALWSWRVVNSHRSSLPGGATSAPPLAQVTGLQETMWIVIGMLVVAVFLSAWAFIRERRLLNGRTQPEP
jgi:EmrB/QacA subfamily drug resistance transporter